jgi:peroxiredoxin
VRLRDQNGSIFSLGDYRGRPLLVDFIYTRCPTLCSERGDDFRRMMKLANWLADADWLGISGIVLVVFGTSFWMLPRALDEAVAEFR